MKEYTYSELIGKDKDILIGIIRDRGNAIKTLSTENASLLSNLSQSSGKCQDCQRVSLKGVLCEVFRQLKLDRLRDNIDRLYFTKTEMIRMIVSLVNSQREEQSNMNRLWLNESKKRSQKELWVGLRPTHSPDKTTMYREAMRGKSR